MNRTVIAFAVAIVVLAGAAIWVSARQRIHQRAPAAVAWRDHLREFRASVDAADGFAAVRAWNQAWQASLMSRRWDAEIEVGDAALVLGDMLKSRYVATADARRAYRAALIRARGQESFDGVVRAGQAFAALGDVDVAQAAFDMASSLAASPHERDEIAHVRSALELTRVVSDPAVHEGDTARGRPRVDAPRILAR